MLYPLRFTPVYFEKVWGDRRLESVLGRTLPPAQPIGESWEVSDHPHGPSVVCNGPLAGVSLHELIERDPLGVLGAAVHRRYGNVFPLLVKYIDADDRLSVQVHPDDDYALEHEDELGKTEMWYLLHADPDACLIAGLQPGATPEAFRLALDAGDPAQLLHALPVKTGDALLIPAGRIHALLPGLLVLEIQENSDTTYRLYDWGRVGLDGQPRALHVKQAMAVADWSDIAPEPRSGPCETEGVNRKCTLATCEYFTVEKYELAAVRVFVTDDTRFHILNCVAGTATLAWRDGVETLCYGDSLLLPAAVSNFTITPQDQASVLLSYVP